MNRGSKIAIIVVGLVAILVLLRIGAAIPASVLGFILFLTALAERLLGIHYMRKNARSAPASAEMTPEQAREMLEVGPDASAAEIKAAYKRLMARIHPDHGGSRYLAAQLNQARDLLLKKNRE